jgi:bifunctional DNase/RNase
VAALIRLSVLSIGVVEETGSVILVLRAAELARLLVMEIGLLEGRAIALEAEGVKAPRPLTHDLLHQVIEALGARVEAVHIRDFQDKTFYATLVLSQEGGRRVELDARPSDAIALALRAGAPIFATEAVLAVAGIDEGETGDELELEVDVDDDHEDDEHNTVVH